MPKSNICTCFRSPEAFCFIAEIFDIYIYMRNDNMYRTFLWYLPRYHKMTTQLSQYGFIFFHEICSCWIGTVRALESLRFISIFKCKQFAVYRKYDTKLALLRTCQRLDCFSVEKGHKLGQLLNVLHGLVIHERSACWYVYLAMILTFDQCILFWEVIQFI